MSTEEVTQMEIERLEKKAQRLRQLLKSMGSNDDSSESEVENMETNQDKEMNVGGIPLPELDSRSTPLEGEIISTLHVREEDEDSLDRELMRDTEEPNDVKNITNPDDDQIRKDAQQ